MIEASTAKTFVLLHGGGHGGWCWQRVARLLRAAGHDVYTPTLTGFGDKSHLVEPAPSFGTFLTDIANLLHYEDLRDVTLVGHSMGGVIIPRVATLLPDRIRQVIWLAAVVCNDGESLIEAVAPTPAMAAAVTIRADGALEQDTAKLVEVVLNDGTACDRAWVGERHCHSPPAALHERGRLSEFLSLDIPTGYIVATADLAIPPETARLFAERLPNARRAELEASHDCMISKPEETMAALLSVTI
jgi:pimeloyl-ACP methyl ester carboxylesterase